MNIIKKMATKPFLGIGSTRLNIAVVAFIATVLLISIILPAFKVRAEQTLTWSSNADFSYNKISGCRETNNDGITISGVAYSDGTCSNSEADSSLSLASADSSLQSITEVATGANYNLALKNDGTVWAWGYNSYGQLGDNTTVEHSIPVQVKDSTGAGYLTDVIAVSAGGNTSFALKSDGTVWGWGYNGNGLIGDNSTVTRRLPVQVLGGLSNVVAISSGGGYHTLALKSDGTVWAWGEGQYGKLGIGSTTNQKQPVQVKSPDGASFITNVTSISAGGRFSLVAKSDGTVWGWGYNGYGELGDNSTTQRSLPVQVVDSSGVGYISGINSVKTSFFSSLALKNDGTVWAWGTNGNGQLGDNTTTQRNIPVQVKDAVGTGYLSDMTAIAGGTSHSLALKNDGTVWAWGANNYGQLGDNSTTQRSLPVQVQNSETGNSLGGITEISSSSHSDHSVAINSNGTVWAWGSNSNGALGDKNYGSASVTGATLVIASVGTINLSDVNIISNGGYHSLALKNDGTVWAWGTNSSGQLGDNTTTQSNVPVQVKDAAGTGNLSGITAIAAGSSHSLALKNDGTVWAWGYNVFGGVGDNSTTQRLLPVQVKDAAGTGYLSGITVIQGGTYHSLALKNDGTVWAWGYNNYGQLGDNSTTQRNIPVQVKDAAGTGYLSDMTAIAGGQYHSLALKNDGTAWAWGQNSYAQLGDNSITQRYLPVQIKGAGGIGFLGGVTKIAAGNDFSLALKNDGTVWAWGNNNYGQLGINSGFNNSSGFRVPNQVVNGIDDGYLGNIANISANISPNIGSALAVGQDGSVIGWGRGNYGHLGPGSMLTANRVPKTVYTQYNYLTGFTGSGSVSGFMVDAGAGKKTKWFAVDWASDALPTGATITFNARTSDDGASWSSWSSDFTQSTTSTTSGTGDLTGLPLSRYLELKATLATSDASVTPTLNSFSLSFMDDQSAPDVNASDITMARTESGAQIVSGGWVNTQTPYFAWDVGVDVAGGTGVQGYCLYLGQDDTADLSQTDGILGTSPLDTGEVCQYAVTTNYLDLSTPGTLGSAFDLADNPYYLLVRAIDYAGHVYEGPAASHSFNYDGTPPTNPAFISAPSQFVASKDVTLTWPTSGDQDASDDDSQVAGLQYKIGTGGTWYGDSHNGNQDLTDLLANDGTYVTDPTIDYSLLVEGNNIIYFRTLDYAGNASASYVTAVIKLNTSSPSSPQNVTADPLTNTTNSFSFSWHAPASYVGPSSALTYCYTINTLPSALTCNYTNPGQTSLAADAFATQPGDNLFYVVARDEAGNINYATVASETFNADTPAPGIPLNLEIADISTKATSTWKLAFSWAEPSNTGSGVAKYEVFRSTNGTNFSLLASTAGLSYVDSPATQTTYYYKVKACDSANNCGAFSEVMSELPTGRYTSPPDLIGSPSVEVSTRTAAFNWTTDRESDSRIQYGVESGVYFAGEIAVSDSDQTHRVDVQNLEAGTTYYYKAKWTDEDGNTGVSSELSFTTLPAPVVKDVEVIKKTLTGALIKFTSTDATKVNLTYGKTEGFGGLSSVNTSSSESSYIVELAGLDDGTTYFYKLSTFDADGNEYDSHRIDSFATPPRPRISSLRFQPVDGEPTSTQKVTWTTNVLSNSTVTYGKINTNGTDTYLSKMTQEHEIVLRGLEDDSTYFLLAQSRDADGNLAVGDRQVFKTALDTRPPKISDIRISTAVKGNGSEARGQIVVSWKTDEPATSQVAYAYGTTGSEYPNKTSEDAQLTTEHVVIVSDLSVSNVYHLMPISRDRAQNATLGQDQSAVIGRATESILNIILNSLRGIFGI